MKVVPNADKAVDNTADELSVRVLRKHEFSKRLVSLMEKKMVRQSDVARATKVGRDSISNYVRGRTVPTPTALGRLSKYFNVSAEELYPNYAQQAMQREQPAYDFKQVAGETNVTWVQINMRLTSKKAAEIMAIIHSDD